MTRRIAALFVAALFMLACAFGEVATPEPTRRLTRTPQPFTPEAQTIATAIPVPSPTPDLSAELCPLTGLRDPAKPWLARRPLLFKIDNSPPARPQSGISRADIVIEHLAEGGVTRFDAAFWCSSADEIGPIRSARIIDLDLVAMFQAVLVHVGASNENLAALRAAYGNRLMDEGTDKAAFHRTSDREAPYNTYTSSEGVQVLLPGRTIAQTGIALKGLKFGEAVPGGGKPAARVHVPYDRQFSDSTWEYAPDAKQFKRGLMGEPLIDAKAGQAVQVANVVVLFAEHTVTDIVEDSLGSRSIQIELKGKGRAVVLRDGQAFEGQWLRDDPKGFIRFTDANGRDIPLRPGRSWWQVVPTDLKLTYP
ncbi:MAG: DUF3048 domain-containing protein [Chloroflexi bacterium]|nr:DUF3048 domain-containing protein [Chloroflexota bacterium]